MFIKMPTMEPNGENLISFMNSVTSSVKTVLAKPGCFKRNTNHRRFLQKQLRQSAQQQTDIIGRNKENASTTLSKIQQKRKLARSKTRPAKVKKEDLNNNSNNEHIPVNSDLPSPTFDYQPGSDINMDDISFYPESSPSYDAPSPMSSKLCFDSSGFLTDFNTDSNISCLSSEYSRSSSPASSVSEEDYCSTDFLTGEELVNTLDITDLFIPENTSNHISPSLYDTCLDYTSKQVFTTGNDLFFEDSRYMIASFERALQKYSLMQF